MSSDFSYDKVVYPSYVFQHIRPDRLAAIAAIHGIEMGDIRNARILELGCGDGANLLSIAYSMPESKCLGVDLSAERISEAKQNAKEIGISNAEFIFADICDLKTKDLGSFDFIIAHGLYSWIPETVCQRVLEIYRDCLSPCGIGYISYNTLPGWHLRGIVREAMLFHTENISQPESKINAALEFLEFLRRSAKSDSVYKSIIESEIESTKDRPPANIFHDDLAGINRPLYFKEFIEEISRFGLKYIAESEPVAFFDRKFPEETREALNRLWDDFIRREQYLDFITCSRFRSSLVCNVEANPEYQPNPASIESLWLASQATAIDEKANLTDNSTVEFRGPFNSTFQINHPFVKSTLGMLADVWPQRVPFAEISKHLRQTFSRLPDERFDEMFPLYRAFLLELFHSMIVELRAFCPDYKLEISARPEVSAFARWQVAKEFDYVTTLTGSNLVPENNLMRSTISLADGTRTKDEIAQSLKSDDDFSTFENLNEVVSENLRKFRNAGLLIG
jgi:SAM-dependent methyltransferase